MINSEVREKKELLKNKREVGNGWKRLSAGNGFDSLNIMLVLIAKREIRMVATYDTKPH